MKRSPNRSRAVVALTSFLLFSCNFLIDPGRAPVCCGPQVPDPGKMELSGDDGKWLSSANATLADGKILITGESQTTITILLQGDTIGFYPIAGSISVANQPDEGSVVFLSPKSPKADSPAYASAHVNREYSGWVDIMAIDKVRKTITGELEIKVSREIPTAEVISFTGAFNKIPFKEKFDNTFAGKVGESEFISTVIAGTKSGEKLALNFYTSRAEAISLFIPSDVTRGTYDLSRNFTSVYLASATESYKALSASLTITEHNIAAKKISGTFNFIAKDSSEEAVSVNVNDASLTIYYTTSTGFQ